MNERNHIPSLDGLRGVAAVIVTVSHIKFVYPEFLHGLSDNIGSAAVAVFFVLSGFLMTVLYSGQPWTRARVSLFLISRLGRVYPVYFCAILLTLLLGAFPELGYPEPITGLVTLVRQVLLIGSVGVFWSIPPEIQFYGLFPVLWLCLSDPVRWRWLSLGLGLTVLAIGLAGFPGPGILLPSKLHLFLAGVVAGYVYRRSERAAHPAHGLLALGLTAGFFGLPTLVPSLDQNPWGLASAIVALMIVFCVAKEHPLSATVFGSRPLTYLGEVSFSVYLLHKPVMYLTARALAPLLPDDLAFAISVLAVVGASALTNRMIEKPARRQIVAWWAGRDHRQRALDLDHASAARSRRASR